MHLWASARLSWRADALCTFLSTLTVSLPVCGLVAGVRSGTVGVGGGGLRCNVRVLCVSSLFLFFLSFCTIIPFLFCMFSLHSLYDICCLLYEKIKTCPSTCLPPPPRREVGALTVQTLLQVVGGGVTVGARGGGGQQEGGGLNCFKQGSYTDPGVCPEVNCDGSEITEKEGEHTTSFWWFRPKQTHNFQRHKHFHKTFPLKIQFDWQSPSRWVRSRGCSLLVDRSDNRRCCFVKQRRITPVAFQGYTITPSLYTTHTSSCRLWGLSLFMFPCRRLCSNWHHVKEV